MKYIKSVVVVSLMLFFVCHVPEAAGKNDEARVREVIDKLLDICAHVDFSDPKTIELGLFYKAAPYVVYRGEDEERR